MMRRIVDSGLIEASVFPSAIQCLELVLECMNKYDLKHRCIRNANGGVSLNVNRETIMVIFKIPAKEMNEDWTITTSYGFFLEKKTQYISVIAINWLLKSQKGDSKLPKPLTREHLIK